RTGCVKASRATTRRRSTSTSASPTTASSCTPPRGRSGRRVGPTSPTGVSTSPPPTRSGSSTTSASATWWRSPTPAGPSSPSATPTATGSCRGRSGRRGPPSELVGLPVRREHLAGGVEDAVRADQRRDAVAVELDPHVVDHVGQHHPHARPLLALHELGEDGGGRVVDVADRGRVQAQPPHRRPLGGDRPEV